MLIRGWQRVRIMRRDGLQSRRKLASSIRNKYHFSRASKLQLPCAGDCSRVCYAGYSDSRHIAWLGSAKPLRYHSWNPSASSNGFRRLKTWRFEYRGTRENISRRMNIIRRSWTCTISSEDATRYQQNSLTPPIINQMHLCCSNREPQFPLGLAAGASSEIGS